MARDGRKRDEETLISGVRLTDLKDTEGIVNKLAEHLNKLKRSVNSPANEGPSNANEGKDGDIRLFKDTADDGSVGYFIEGKFGNNWAVQRLSLVVHNEEAGDSSSANESFGSESYSLSDLDSLNAAAVTFLNLQANGDVGVTGNTVSEGNHTHDHDTLANNGGNGHHAEIETHMNNDDLHREANTSAISTASVHNGVIDAIPGGSSTWAPSDHEHVLDQSKTYSFTNLLSVAKDSDAAAALTVTNNDDEPAIKATALSGLAIETNGDVKIDGDAEITGSITVAFGEAAAGGATIGDDTSIDGVLTVTGDISGDEDLSIDKDVNLNGPLTGGAVTDDYDTTIWGKTYHKHLVEIDHQLGVGEKHLTLTNSVGNYGTFEVDNNGTMYVHASGNVEIHPDIDGSGTDPRILPKGDSLVDIGYINRRFRSLFVSEIYAEKFIAQEVLATTGGRIMVAPTTNLIQDLGDDVTDTTIEVEHNNLNDEDFIMLRSYNVNAIEDNSEDEDGLPVTFEVMTVASGPSTVDNGSDPDTYEYTVVRNTDGSGLTTWSKSDAVVNIGHEAGDGWIELTATKTMLQTLGPSISMYARPSDTSTWDDASVVAHIGDIDTFAGISGTRFGAAFGKNLTSQATAVSDPFTGLLVDEADGVTIYNTPFKQYYGTSLNAYIGPDAAGNTALVIGEGLSEASQGVWTNSKLLFSKSAGGEYVLTIDGDVSLTGYNTNSWPFLETQAEVVEAMSNMTDTASPSGDGFYLNTDYIGYYKSGGAETEWPIQLGNVGSNQYAYIGNTDKTNYLEYNSGTLTVKGTLISESETETYASCYEIGSEDNSTSTDLVDIWVPYPNSIGHWQYKHPFYVPLTAKKVKVEVIVKDVESSNNYLILNNLRISANDGMSVGANNVFQTLVFEVPEIDENSEVFNGISHSSFQTEYPGVTEQIFKDSVNYLSFHITPTEYGADKYEVHYIKVSYELDSVTSGLTIDDDENFEDNISDVTSDIIIGDGSIILGNLEGNSIETYGKVDYTTTDSGIWMGMIDEDQPGINIGDATNYLKYDGTNLLVKGAASGFEWDGTSFTIGDYSGGVGIKYNTSSGSLDVKGGQLTSTNIGAGVLDAGKCLANPDAGFGGTPQTVPFVLMASGWDNTTDFPTFHDEDPGPLDVPGSSLHFENVAVGAICHVWSNWRTSVGTMSFDPGDGPAPEVSYNGGTTWSTISSYAGGVGSVAPAPWMGFSGSGLSVYHAIDMNFSFYVGHDMFDTDNLHTTGPHKHTMQIRWNSDTVNHGNNIMSQTSAIIYNMP